MNLNTLTIGDRVYLNLDSGSGHAHLIAKINANSKPDPKHILRWYGDSVRNYESAFRAINIDRYIFQKDNGHYVVVPDSERCRESVERR